MEPRWITLLRARVEEKINERADHITQGGSPDYASYKSHCGYIEGLHESIKLLDDILKEMSGGS